MARRFVFRLETVLRLRRRALNDRRRAVGEASRAVTQMKVRIAFLTEQARHTVLERRREKGTTSLDVALLRGHQLHAGWLHRKIMESQAELAKRIDELTLARAGLAEAMKQVKVIEKLREKQWLRHLDEVAREERAEQDEAAQQLYLRRLRANSEVHAA